MINPLNFVFCLFSNRLKKSPQKKISSNRTVLLTRPLTISNENQQNPPEESKPKRLKIDPSTLSPSNPIDNSDNSVELRLTDFDLQSIVAAPVNIDDHHDCRYDLNEKRRIDASNSRSSRSRSDSKSGGDHHLEERQRRRSPTNSHRSSSKDSRTSSQIKSHRHSQPIRDDHQRQRSRNNHHQISDRHEFFRESSIEHQRQPARHKLYNYNHRSITDHPRFVHTNVLPATSTRDFDRLPSSSRHSNNSSSMSTGDRK